MTLALQAWPASAGGPSNLLHAIAPALLWPLPEHLGCCSTSISDMQTNWPIHPNAHPMTFLQRENAPGCAARPVALPSGFMLQVQRGSEGQGLVRQTYP